MILELTIETLTKNGYTKELANKLVNESADTYSLQCNEGNFYISKSENKVYTDIDYYRKIYFEIGNLKLPYNCPDLIPDYYSSALFNFLKKQETTLGILFSETDQTKKFIYNEIRKTQERIEAQKEFLKKMKHNSFESKEADIQICEAYIEYLNTKTEPQQTKIIKSDEVEKELYNHIFKGNAFEVWQSMYDSFQITENSRTDVKFMFEEMKKDGLIHKTVNQKTFLDWLSEPPYQITIQKTSNYSKTNVRNSIYHSAKQLYRS